MRFSEYLALNRQKRELDFVDIDKDRDLPLFIDPYVLSRRDDLWSQDCAVDIISFFQTAVDAIRAGDHTAASYWPRLSVPVFQARDATSGVIPHILRQPRIKRTMP